MSPPPYRRLKPTERVPTGGIIILRLDWEIGSQVDGTLGVPKTRGRLLYSCRPPSDPHGLRCLV